MNYTYKRFNTYFISNLILISKQTSFTFGCTFSTLEACPNSSDNLLANVLLDL